MKVKQAEPLTIRRLKITNYKGIDFLELEFPEPKMVGDPDITVMGSENGLGKTSVIESCALLLLALRARGERQLGVLRSRYSPDVPDLLIRAGSQFAKIEGTVVQSGTEHQAAVVIQRDGKIEVSVVPEVKDKKRGENPFFPTGDAEDIIPAICGFTTNPVIVDRTFMLFHSYRKVQEGNPELGMMVRPERGMQRPMPERYLRSRYDFPMSAFKLRILRSLMSRANLFDLGSGMRESEDETMTKLNGLVVDFAGGQISKLKPLPDNTVDIRIEPQGGGEAFTFDSLSSGQKEIISTLFLIWDYTRDSTAVVFIDEPELHLNAQWHRSFIRRLLMLSPNNQYIIATHSEDIMDSVDPSRRRLLARATEAEQ